MSLGLIFCYIYLLHIVKASSRCKQLKRYKGSWATLEIIKMLLKNRCTYRSRIGSLAEEQESVCEKEGDYDGNNSGNENTNDDDENSNNEWDDMYMAYKENHSSGDEDDNNSDGGVDKDGNGSDNNGDKGEVGNGLGNNSDEEDGNGLDDIGNGEDGNGGKHLRVPCFRAYKPPRSDGPVPVDKP